MTRVEFDKSAGNRIKVACRACHRDTNHVILKSVEESWSEPMGPEAEIHWSTGYQIIQCQGC